MGGVGSGRRKGTGTTKPAGGSGGGSVSISDSSFGKFKIVDKDLGFRKALENAAKLNKKIKVGIQGSDAEETKKDHNDEPISGITVVDVGTWHEFGTEEIPQRSFLGATIDQNSKEYREIMDKLKEKVLTGKIDVDKALGLIGQKITADAKERIKKGLKPDLEPETVARKGSSTPLIDTGQLRQSITYTIEGNK